MVLFPQLSEVDIIRWNLVLFTRRQSCASQPELQQQRRLNGIEASDLSVIVAEQDAAVSGPLTVLRCLPSGRCNGRLWFSGEHGNTVDEMIIADFHDSIFLLCVIVTTDRIYRIQTGSNDLYKTRLLSHFALYVHNKRPKHFWIKLICQTGKSDCIICV